MNKIEATTEIVKIMIIEGKLAKNFDFKNPEEKYNFVIGKIKTSITEIYKTFDKLEK